MGISLARAHALYAACAARYGAKETGMNYEEMEMITELERNRREAADAKRTEEQAWAS